MRNIFKQDKNSLAYLVRKGKMNLSTFIDENIGKYFQDISPKETNLFFKIPQNYSLTCIPGFQGEISKIEKVSLDEIKEKNLFEENNKEDFPKKTLIFLNKNLLAYLEINKTKPLSIGSQSSYDYSGEHRDYIGKLKIFGKNNLVYSFREPVGMGYDSSNIHGRLNSKLQEIIKEETKLQNKTKKELEKEKSKKIKEIKSKIIPRLERIFLKKTFPKHISYFDWFPEERDIVLEKLEKEGYKKTKKYLSSKGVCWIL